MGVVGLNILLRDIDVVAVKKIDEMAKKERVSRNEFLKKRIEEIAYKNMKQKEFLDYEKRMNLFIDSLEKLHQRFSKTEEDVEVISTFLMQLTGTEKEELKHFWREFLISK